MKTALLLLAMVTPVWAQTFDSQAAQAGQLLQQFKLEKANGAKTDWNTRDKAALAGDAWLAAAKLASTEAQRFQAYEQAGLAYTNSQTGSDDALGAFRLARDVSGASGKERARAGILAAHRAHTRAEWELVTALNGATPQQLASAYHEIGLTYIVPAKTDASLQTKIVESYEKAAEQMAKYDPLAADTELGIASVTAQSITPAAQAVAALNRIYPRLLALPLSPDQKPLRNSRIETNWGAGLQKVGAVDRAVATWQKVGSNATYPAEQREEAWVKAADALKGQAKVDKALAALQAATPLRADNYVFSGKLAEKKLDLLDANKRWADSLKVVQELAKHPRLPADRKEGLLLAEARYLYRLKRAQEAEAVLAPLWQNPPRAGKSIYLVAVEKIQAALDAKDAARARAEIEAGLARLREIQAAPHQLEYVSAKVYGADKQFTKAIEAYTRCCGGAPSDTVVNEARQLFSQALAAKKFSDAQAISAEIGKWRIDSMVTFLMQAQMASAAGDTVAARSAVARCRQELQRFYGARKDAFEKEIAGIEATIR